jgi:hypothetical protein
MKKRLESELMSIAHRILKLKGKEDLQQLHFETQKLYESLSILKFVEENIGIIQPKIDLAEVEQKLEEKLDYQPEISFEMDNDYIIQLENELEELREDLDKIEEKIESKIDRKTVFFEDLIAQHKEPIFERFEDKPLEVIEKEEIVFESNEKSTLGITISLNDRIGFVKHLFDDSNEDFNRVLSQLSTLDSFDEAKDFIENMVKPDYDNWEGEEDFETRFMRILEQKFL